MCIGVESRSRSVTVSLCLLNSRNVCFLFIFLYTFFCEVTEGHGEHRLHMHDNLIQTLKHGLGGPVCGRRQTGAVEGKRLRGEDVTAAECAFSSVSYSNDREGAPDCLFKTN